MNRFLQTISLFVALLLSPWMATQSHAQGGIVVRDTSVADLSLDEVGILTANQGGLGPDIWRQTSHENLEKLILLLPKEQQSETLSNLKRRLLTTIAVAPRSVSEKKADLFILRLKQLAAMGAYEETFEMVERVPLELRSEEMLQIIIASRLVAGKTELACTAIKANMAQYQLIGWRKWMALCQAFEGNAAASKLTQKLLAENGFKVDDAFASLAKNLAAEGKVKEEAQRIWGAEVAETVLKLPDVEVVTPTQKFLDADLMFNAKLTSWWAGVDKDDPKARAQALVKLYGMLLGLGDVIHADDWLHLALFTIKKVDDISVHHQLIDALLALTGQKRKGEVLAVMLMMVGNEKVSSLPTATLNAMLTSLTQLGYQKEAESLAAEALQ